MDEIIIKLDLLQGEIATLKTELRQYNKESIKWSIEDFEQKVNDWKNPEKYDPAKFQDALERMIEKHDAEIGITWETIGCYLDDYCLKE